MTLEPDDVYRINRVRVAKYYHVLPEQVDAMPEQDYLDTLEVMWADQEIEKARAAKMKRRSS